jgi:signal-transduction protein with cAMP-binding, CBS, and nucleotidyltransferase domain
MEGEPIQEMYFIVYGKVAYVIPKYNNKILEEFNQGDHFGHSELFHNK